ncbi:MAG: hypothetical protein WDN50_03015 [Bradyrhizobium sp.]
MIRRLIVPLTLAVATFHAGQFFTNQAFAQGAFPAPLPGRAAAPANDSAFPPVNGAAPTTSLGAAGPASFPTNGAAPVGGFGGPPAGPTMSGTEAECMKAFMPLREEAEKRGKLIKAASDRHAPPDEACKLISNFSVAETKMLKYVETHLTQCGIPPQVLDQLKNGHKNSEGMQQKICAVAQQVASQPKGPAGPSLSEVLGSSTALPEANNTKKGSTFDTLNGNVLAR